MSGTTISSGTKALTLAGPGYFVISSGVTINAGYTAQNALTLTGAGPDTIDNSGTLNGGITGNGIALPSGLVINQASGRIISGAGKSGVISSGNLTLENAGYIISAYAGPAALIAATSGSVAIVENASGGHLQGSPIYLKNGSDTLSNAGTITVGFGNDGILETGSINSIQNLAGGQIYGTGGQILMLQSAASAMNMLTNSGTVHNTSGMISIEQSGTSNVLINFAGGVLQGEIDQISTSQAGASPGQGNTIINYGTIQKDGLGIDLSGTSTETDTIINYGTIGGVSGTGLTYIEIDQVAVLLEMAPNAAFIGRFDANASRSNHLELLSGGSQGIITNLTETYRNFETIAIDTGGAWTLEDIYAGFSKPVTINNFHAGDTLEIGGFIATGEHYANGILTLSGAGSNVTVHISTSLASPAFQYTNTANMAVVTLCFFPGTRIATAIGETAVEDLRAGEMVLTANGPMPVRWLGRSDVCTQFADKLRSLPIRICAGALGAGLPRRDLLVSPDHAVFLHGVLVQAAALVDGVTILRERNVPEFFSYYHVELASHELILAEGAWAESFVDHVERRHFHNWDERSAPALPIAELPYPRVKAARQLPLGLRARKVA
jgi:hypothetical protein